MVLDAGVKPNPVSQSPVAGSVRSGLSKRQWPLVYAVYALLQGLQLLLLGRAAPRLFWYDDAQSQFAPVMWWMGRNLEDGRPPLLDPEQGVAGNFTADMQYGVLDPFHWLMQALAATTDDLLLLSWVYGGCCLLLLGFGALSVLLHYRVTAVLAVAGALGIASSGFLVWYGSSWWPLLWSVAWLPWLWLGMATRRWPGALLAGVATWALLAAGNPYAVPFALLLVLAQVWERYREAGSVRDLLDRDLLGRAVACVGGLIIALPTLLSAIELAPLLGRPLPEKLVGNEAFGVSNFADVALGGMTLLGQTNAWGGSLGLAPAMSTMIVALPLLALVSWRSAWQAPGVPTAALVLGLAAAATQLPTVVSVFRYPLRYLTFVQIFLALLAILAVSAAPRINRARLRLAFALVLVQGLLAVARAPELVEWHLVALLITAASLVAAVFVCRGTRGRALAGVALIMGASAGIHVAERMMESLEARRGAIASAPFDVGQPLRPLNEGYELGETVGEYRERAYSVDEVVTVLYYGGFPADRGWDFGVLDGSGNLFAGLRGGYGASASWQTELQKHWCRDYQGATCSDPRALLADVPGTDSPWVDVLSADTVVFHNGAPAMLRQHFESTWDTVDVRGPWTEYVRDDDLPGRVTVAKDVEVRESGWFAGLAYAGRPHDRYIVSTGDSEGLLVLRIPYFEGFRATLDGQSLPVSSVDQSVLTIELPPGVRAGSLAISYAPAGVRIAEGAWLVGALLLGVGAAVASRARPARRRSAHARDRAPSVA